MYSIKQIIIIAVITFAGMLSLVSCHEQGKSALPGSGRGQSFNKEAISRNIEALGSADWDAAVYGEILNNQISASTQLNEQDKEALVINLNKNYIDQVLRCADSIMDNACSGNHAKLKEMMATLADVEPKLLNDYKAAERAALKQRLSLHDVMLSFSVSSSYNKSWQQPYDYSYDSKKKSEAASYRAKKPTCTAVMAKIDKSKVESILRQRKAAYDALVAKHAYKE